jgi:peptidoglycan hydrolase-like protein with peptidoglycan-binding domain
MWRSRRQTAITAADLVAIASALALVLGACSARDRDEAVPSGSDQAGTSMPVETTTTAPPTTTTLPPTTTTSTTPPPPTYRPGSAGPEVLALEQRLVELGFRPGPVDGTYTAETASAVMAYQKHEGLGRDGIAGPETMGAVFAPLRGPGPLPWGPVPRLEIDLDRQIMFVLLGDGSVTALNISSGNNQTYHHPAGYTAVAATPVGQFAVERKIDAAEHAPLGTLYRPMYFKGGFAVHGSTSVPGYPASHGCVRTSYADQDWLFPLIPRGTPVVVRSGGPVIDPGTDAPLA